jgi:hypothetical protein
LAARKGQLLTSSCDTGVLCLASSESQAQVQNPLGIWIAGLSGARRSIRCFFVAVQWHTLAELRVQLVTPKATLVVAAIENTWWIFEATKLS